MTKHSAHRKIPILDQWIEVSVENGKTLTEFFPDNEVLKEEARTMHPQPELVYRRIFFPGGVPEEYSWTMPDDQVRQYGGGCIQRLTFATWLSLIVEESMSATGHIGPSTDRYIPRPNERGGCDCPPCAANQHVLEELGYST